MPSPLIRFFRKDSVLIFSVMAGIILWSTDAFLNMVQLEYTAFFIDMLFVVCLSVMGPVAIRDDEQDRKMLLVMIHSLMVDCILGNVNVLSGTMTSPLPSRVIWQIVFVAALTLLLFINHFILSLFRPPLLWMIALNQLIVLFLLGFRLYQISLNIAHGGFSLTVFRLMLGLLGLIPALNVVVCIEWRMYVRSLAAAKTV